MHNMHQTCMNNDKLTHGLDYFRNEYHAPVGLIVPIIKALHDTLRETHHNSKYHAPVGLVVPIMKALHGTFTTFHESALHCTHQNDQQSKVLCRTSFVMTTAVK